MKAVLLAGGLGTRMREETEFRPKPMVEVGGKPGPVAHHEDLRRRHGVKDFVVCAGYKGEMIKEYFLNYEARNNDFTITLGRHGQRRVPRPAPRERLDGDGRRHRRRHADRRPGRAASSAYVEGERFMVTYGDGLADVDIAELLAFHEAHGRKSRPSRRCVRCPGSARRPRATSRGQALPREAADRRLGQRRLLRLRARRLRLPRDSDDMHARARAARTRSPTRAQLVAYQHDGFWQPMDTYRESQMLNEMWDTGEAPWKVWE